MNKQLVPDDLFWCGVKIILKNKDNQILLLKKPVKDKDFWELPGGRMRVGETQLDALHREIAEETGITAIDNIHHITMFISKLRFINDHQPTGLVFSIFKGSVHNNTVILSNDHKDYAWVTEKQAVELVGNTYGEIFKAQIT